MLFGIDRIEEEKKALSGRLALISAPSGRTLQGESSIDCLKRNYDLRLLLAPEHGVRGDIADGIPFDSGVDRISGLPMMSMYRKGSYDMPDEAFDFFDTLVYDIQDVGARFYTFISTLKHAMRQCAVKGKRVVVLDRPNPLGSLVEGCIRTPETASFVGCHDIPAIYGMTCGEFALMVRDEEKLDLDLTVVRCEGYSSDMVFEDWKRPWLMTSPAMPDIETVRLYAGLCLLEGTNISEGRGTAAPFRLIGAPFVKSEDFAAAFNSLELPGVFASPYWFSPNSSKYQGELCGGIRLYVTDPRTIRPLTVGVCLLDLFRCCYPDEFGLRQYTEQDTTTLPFISLLAGHRLFENSDWSLHEVLSMNREGAAAFEERRSKYVLY